MDEEVNAGPEPVEVPATWGIGERDFVELSCGSVGEHQGGCLRPVDTAEPVEDAVKLQYLPWQPSFAGS